MNWYCLCEGLDLLDGLNGELLAPVFGLRLDSIVLAVRITMHNTLGVPTPSQDRARIKTQAHVVIESDVPGNPWTDLDMALCGG